MLKSIEPGHHTVTIERMWDVFNRNVYQPGNGTNGRQREVICLEPEEDIAARLAVKLGQLDSKRKYETPLRRFCKEAVACTEDVGTHLEQLDFLLSKHLISHFLAHEDRPHEKVVRLAFDLITRLPAYPSELKEQAGSSLIKGLPQECYVKCAESQPCCASMPSASWSHLQVVRTVSTVVIQFAIQVAADSLNFPHHTRWLGVMADFLDFVARAFRESGDILDAEDEQQRSRWILIRSFLWTSWQRLTMLFSWAVLNQQLQDGFYHNAAQTYIGSRVPIFSDNIPANGGGKSSSAKADYMCNWAFELLRSDRACLTQDFRRFHAIYTAEFGALRPRCNKTAQKDVFTSCGGKSADRCNRFKGMKPEDQSAHDTSCSADCRPLVWDEESYRGVQGARAVKLVEPEDVLLKYCAASNSTMAVSHVWAHGQGGRPALGMNSCLHRRYVRIAQSLGCDSYWMDTPCIPEDHQLRDEAISQINPTFASSKVVLVADRDLMGIDISGAIDLETSELLLVAIIVSDWNVRAWTLLEGMKGRRNLYLLCKNNAVTPLKEHLNRLHKHGNIDVAILSLTVQHLIPHRYQIPPLPRPASDDLKCLNCLMQEKSCDGARPKCSSCRALGSSCRYKDFIGPPTRGQAFLNKGFELDWLGHVSIEEAICLLHHRHASRPGDEIVIWSLLIGEEVFKTAESFWKAQTLGTSYLDNKGAILTGSLVSSSLRVKGHKGLGWAPSRPDLQTTDVEESAYYPYDGKSSMMGFIKSNGLEAEWLIHILKKPPTVSSFSKAVADKVTHKGKYKNASARGFMGRKRLLNIAFAYGKWKWVALLLPAEANNSDTRPIIYRGPAAGPLVVIVATNNGLEWEWLCVTELAELGGLPELARATITLV